MFSIKANSFQYCKLASCDVVDCASDVSVTSRRCVTVVQKASTWLQSRSPAEAIVRARRITTNPTRRIIHQRPNPVTPTSWAELPVRPRLLGRRDAAKSIVWPAHSVTDAQYAALRYVASLLWRPHCYCHYTARRKDSYFPAVLAKGAQQTSKQWVAIVQGAENLSRNHMFPGVQRNIYLVYKTAQMLV